METLRTVSAHSGTIFSPSDRHNPAEREDNQEEEEEGVCLYVFLWINKASLCIKDKAAASQ